jgi:hypothetical protein
VRQPTAVLRGPKPRASDAEQAVAQPPRGDATPRAGFLAETGGGRRARPTPASSSDEPDGRPGVLGGGALAPAGGLAVLPGTEGPTTPAEAHAFLTSLGGVP